MENLVLRWNLPKGRKKVINLFLEKGGNKELFSASTTNLQEEISKKLLTVKGSRFFEIKNVLFGEKSIQIKFSGSWAHYQTSQVESELKKNIPEIAFIV